MELTASAVDAIVDAELAAIGDPAVLDLVARLRIAPREAVAEAQYSG
jgi:hypothetical protein